MGRRKLSYQQALINLQMKHGDKLRFPFIRTEYIGVNSLILAVCKIHDEDDDEFISTCNSLRQGKGCPICGNQRSSDALALTHEAQKIPSDQAFVNMLNIPGYKYDFPYFAVEYEDSKSVITYICKTHGEQSATYGSLSHGHGCPKCHFEKLHLNLRNVIGKSGLADYATYHNKLVAGDNPTEGSSGELQVTCHHPECGKVMTPTLVQVSSRIRAISRLGNGECNFYCSDACKSNCTVFGQSSSSKLYDAIQAALVARARGCQPKDKRMLLQMQIDDWGYNFCDRCGNVELPSGLCLHHTIEVAKDPIGAIDQDGRTYASVHAMSC